MDDHTKEQYLQESSASYAGFWIRCWAFLLDLLFLYGVGLVIFNPIRRALGQGIAMDEFSVVDWIETFLDLSYFILFTWFVGQTLGKMIMGIRVVNDNPNTPRSELTLWQVLLREVFGRLLSIGVFGLGVLWVAFSSKKQGWHDLMTRTIVVKERHK